MTYAVGERATLPGINLGTPYPDPRDKRKTVTIGGWLDYQGWLPILTELTQDETYINASLPLHYHIQWQFASPRLLEKVEAFVAKHSPWRNFDSIWNHTITFGDEQRSFVRTQPHEFVCQREAPPPMDYGYAHWIHTLFVQYQCTALVAGRCPHRGTPEAAMIRQADGTLLCPAHGLRFDAETKRVAPLPPDPSLQILQRSIGMGTVYSPNAKYLGFTA